MSEAEDPPTSDHVPNYDNPEAKDRLDAAREQLQQNDEMEAAMEAATARSAREVLAAEDQPGRDLPDLTDTFEVEFRGHTFEFQELGDSFIEAAREVGQAQGEDDAEAGARSAEYIYQMLGEKCTHPDADEAYWRQYDLQRDDTDGIFDLFDELSTEAMGEPDLDPEERERVEEFRGE